MIKQISQPTLFLIILITFSNCNSAKGALDDDIKKIADGKTINK